jgi:hypothetical protein
MATATPAQGPAQYLHSQTTAEVARKALEAGKVTPDDVYAWATTTPIALDRHLIELADALPGSEMTQGVFLAQQRMLQSVPKVRVTVGKTGRVVLNGITRKGEGFPPNFTPRQLAGVLDNATRLIDHVLAVAEKKHPRDATYRGQRAGWRKGDNPEERWVDVPHPRADKWVLAWESETERKSTLRRLYAIRAKLTA